ncbi:hypothetical protein CGRA01v4_15014 [Colletotrichum graminicola]|nr:hypothetical protein CGRA01v4_15014 [Colletotrichum graminicola]
MRRREAFDPSCPTHQLVSSCDGGRPIRRGLVPPGHPISQSPNRRHIASRADRPLPARSIHLSL